MGKLFTLIAFTEVLNVSLKGGSLVMPTVNLECGAVCISIICVVLYKFCLFRETSAFAILKHIIIVIIFYLVIYWQVCMQILIIFTL